MTSKNRIIIFGPKDDGTYVVDFRTAAVNLVPRHHRFGLSSPVNGLDTTRVRTVTRISPLKSTWCSSL